jgi:membrane protease YdiL (CAAX protease family)
MAKALTVREWVACASLVALDVGPSWYKSRTTVLFLLAGTSYSQLLANAVANKAPSKAAAAAAATKTSESRSRTPTSTSKKARLFANLHTLAWKAGQSQDVVCIAALIIFRRLATLVIRRRWINFLSNEQTNKERSRKSFLSPPTDIKDLIQVLVDGGPLGPGCGKLLEVCIGWAFLNLAHWYLPSLDHLPPWTIYCSIGPLVPNWWLPTCVLLLSLATNAVLWIWSTSQQKSRGAHEGVHRMVIDTMNRKLSGQEHVLLIIWSFINAFCEEIISRGFNRWEFSSIQGTEVSTLNGHLDPIFGWSNLWQATTFGLAHFYGVPSGWTGVLLTFVYGGLMGLLQSAGGGLLYPILTHTMADYFIVSQIARRR